VLRHGHLFKNLIFETRGTRESRASPSLETGGPVEVRVLKGRLMCGVREEVRPRPAYPSQ
jgi:hypothetical protein